MVKVVLELPDWLFFYSIQVLRHEIILAPMLVAYAIRSTGFSGSDVPEGLLWQRCTYGSDTSSIRWAATYDKGALYVIVSDQANPDKTGKVSTISGITVKIEPRRLWLCARFVFNIGDKDLIIEIAGSGNNPIVNIPLVIKNWGNSAPAFSIDGKRITDSDKIRVGFRDNLVGPSDLILFIEQKSTQTTRIEISGS